jgi:hypothetical protein
MKPLLLFLSALFLLVAGQSKAADGEVLSNQSIIEMKELGLGDNIVIQKIKTTPAIFDVTVKGLKSLKAATVSEAVIAAMLARADSKTESEKTAGTSNSEPDNPTSPHAPGIYLYETLESKPRMTKIDPSSYKLRQGSMIGAGFGVPIKQQAVLRSQTAKSETTNRKPVFYFYFDKPASGLGDATGQATSPDAFTLGVFEVLKKENERRIVIGNYNVYSGGESGVESKFIHDLDFEKVSPGVFKVVPKDDLRNGEYAFYTPGNLPETAMGTFTTGGKLFDFRVNGSPDTEPPAETKKKPSKRQTTK